MSVRDVVLVTGGAGFIGSELVAQLVAAGRRVRVVDNLVNGKRENLAGLDPGRCELAVADIRDGERMSALLADVGVVFHLACLGVRHSIHSPRENHEVNATASLELVERARQQGVGRVVYVSSSEVYGTARFVPQTEEHPTVPCTVYGGSKLAGESYVRAAHRVHGYPTVVVRPFNAYGPRSHHEGDSGEVIPRFLLRANAGLPLIVFGDGSQTRDFTFVADTARGIALAGWSERAVGETINLGSGFEITVNELAREVARATGRKDVRVEHDRPRPGDVLRLYSDSSRAKELLGFTPEVALDEGLRRLQAWYLGRGVPFEQLLREEVVHNWQGGSARG